jgi:hypothetical protein
VGAQYSTVNLAALLTNFPYALSSGSDVLAQRLTNRLTEISYTNLCGYKYFIPRKTKERKYRYHVTRCINLLSGLSVRGLH